VIRVTKRYPLEPLAALIGCEKSALARKLNLSGTTWQEYRDLGVSAHVADGLAVKAGLHPFNVWPELADDMVAEAEEEARDRRRREQEMQNARRRERWAKDAEWREEAKAKRRAKYREETRDVELAKQKLRYDRDRERIIARQRAYRARKRVERAA
jgi:hypothetical protein